MKWTPEQNAEVARMWLSGATYAAIAKVFSVTRNAAVGRVSALKLPTKSGKPRAEQPTKSQYSGEGIGHLPIEPLRWSWPADRRRMETWRRARKAARHALRAPPAEFFLGETLLISQKAQQLTV